MVYGYGVCGVCDMICVYGVCGMGVVVWHVCMMCMIYVCVWWLCGMDVVCLVCYVCMW